ncbi:MAG: hypothetical protein JWP88_1822 [Flaviaesturariibacter sp.]|nr:hypothetical protein [Flaviaesturariibacter sp.]
MKPFRPLYKTYLINHPFHEVTYYLGNLEEYRHKIQADDIFGGSDSYPSPVYTFYTKLAGGSRLRGSAYLNVVAEQKEDKTLLFVRTVPNYFFAIFMVFGILFIAFLLFKSGRDTGALRLLIVPLFCIAIGLIGESLGKNILLGTFERCLYDFSKQTSKNIRLGKDI